MKAKRRCTLWFIAVAAALHIACKLEDFSFLRFTRVSVQESEELAKRGFGEACARARLPTALFRGPKLKGIPDESSSAYYYDWEAVAEGASVTVRVFVCTKGKVQWFVAGDIERMRQITAGER